MIKLSHLVRQWLFKLAILSVIVLIISQLFGRMFWQIELFSHFVPHYTLVILLSAIFLPSQLSPLFTPSKTKIHLVFLSLTISLILFCLAPFNLFWQNNIQASILPRYNPVKISYQNVNIGNPDPTQVFDTLTKTNPDLLILLEPSPSDWQQVIANQTNYRPLCQHDEESPFSLKILVNKNTPQPTCQLQSLADFPLVKITLADGRIIYAVHPPPPLGNGLANARLAYLHGLHDLVMNEKSAVMLIGDMNLSAFSPVYRDFIKDTSLQRQTMNGLPTWLPLGIGIDQVLVSQKLAKTDVTPLGWNGSDHRGFVVVW